MVINKYTVTFNITPSDATVNYSIDSQTYNQTTTGTGTVSNVPHGSTIYYKISKGGYEYKPIYGSQVITNNVTITKQMETATYYILVSTAEDAGGSYITKYNNSDRSLSEQISIPDGSNKYKIDNLYYGFKTEYCMITNIYCAHMCTHNITNMSSMFASIEFCLNIFNISNFDTSNVTDMTSMFAACKSLTSLDLSNFNTSNVTDMTSMFDDCQQITSLDLSNFNTSKVTDMTSMFYYCEKLASLDLSNFDISKVTNMRDMFYYCNSLNHIKCKQAFKNWCWTNQDTIDLPVTMRSGGSGRWEIVG